MDIELTEKEIRKIEDYYLKTFRGKRLTWEQVRLPKVGNLIKALRKERKKVEKLKKALGKQYRWIKYVTKHGYGSFEGVTFNRWNESSDLKNVARELLAEKNR